MDGVSLQAIPLSQRFEVPAPPAPAFQFGSGGSAAGSGVFGGGLTGPAPSAAWGAAPTAGGTGAFVFGQAPAQVAAPFQFGVARAAGNAAAVPAAAAIETARPAAGDADSTMQLQPIPTAQAAAAMATAATGLGGFGASQAPASSAAASAAVQQEAANAAAGSSAPSAGALQQPFRLPSTLSEAFQEKEGHSNEDDGEPAADDVESGTEGSDEELMSRWEAARSLTCSSRGR